MIPGSDNSYPTRVEIIEVGPRDGLQRERTLVSADDKFSLINDLIAAGLRRIQVTSFVHPRLVPQMADAEELCARLPRHEHVEFSGLALNLKGLQRAHDAGLHHIDMSISASDAHSRRNTNMTLKESLAEFNQMVEKARAYGMVVRGGVQCAFGYLRPDDVKRDTVIDLVQHHLQLGIDQLALADSSGLANPRNLADIVEECVSMAGDIPVALHLHDTRGMGLANVVAGLRAGVRQFDTAFGGLGGCPFIAGAAGNIATEDTAHMLHQMGIDTGIDLALVARVSRRFEQLLGKGSLPGKLYSLLSPEEEAVST